MRSVPNKIFETLLLYGTLEFPFSATFTFTFERTMLYIVIVITTGPTSDVRGKERGTKMLFD